MINKEQGAAATFCLYQLERMIRELSDAYFEILEGPKDDAEKTET